MDNSLRMSKEYTTIRIPKEITEEIEDIIKELKLGYRNKSEFIIETVRNRVIKLRKDMDL